MIFIRTLPVANISPVCCRGSGTPLFYRKEFYGRKRIYCFSDERIQDPYVEESICPRRNDHSGIFNKESGRDRNSWSCRYSLYRSGKPEAELKKKSGSCHIFLVDHVANISTYLPLENQKVARDGSPCSAVPTPSSFLAAYFL